MNAFTWLVEFHFVRKVAFVTGEHLKAVAFGRTQNIKVALNAGEATFAFLGLALMPLRTSVFRMAGPSPEVFVSISYFSGKFVTTEVFLVWDFPPFDETFKPS